MLMIFALFIQGTVATRKIGYWLLSATGSGTCPNDPKWTPSSPAFAKYYTHLNYGFSPPISDQFTLNDPSADELQNYKQLIALKQNNPGLQIGISIGGDLQSVKPMSDACSSDSSRAAFANSAVQFARKYGFDGIDVDWEYPARTDRGGALTDVGNFPPCMKAIRDAINADTSSSTKLWFSVALPGGSYWGQNYNVGETVKYVDWFNIMAYNIHGTWEPVAQCSAPLHDPYKGKGQQNNSIENAINFFVGQSGNLPSKFNLGISFWGIGFVVNGNPSTYQLGVTDTYTSDAKASQAGVCSRQPGYMAYFETLNLLKNPTTFPVTLDPLGQCQYFVYNTSQLIAYEDPSTLATKIKFAYSKGLGGISVWGMDSDTRDLVLHQSLLSAASKTFAFSLSFFIFVVNYI
ncbi:hypothetical protein HDV06_003670 [Boothiomyces sp. JEL0866]|nr:hypothetical protein HDV06_003670 [Boothiomyces sp. JEL0866]